MLDPKLGWRCISFFNTQETELRRGKAGCVGSEPATHNKMRCRNQKGDAEDLQCSKVGCMKGERTWGLEHWECVVKLLPSPAPMRPFADQQL